MYERAIDLLMVGRRLHELQLTAEALPVMEHAAAAYRELAETFPDRYLRDLAITLSLVADYLQVLGRPGDAVPVLQEALAIFRKQGSTRNIGMTLGVLSETLVTLGRPAEALPAIQEATVILDELQATDPDTDHFLSAHARFILGACLLELGRTAEALPVTQQSVTTLRELRATDPGSPHPADYPAALANLAAILLDLRRPAEALQAGQEAAAIYRQAAHWDPYRYRWHLTVSLSTLGAILSVLDRTAEAQRVTQEAESASRMLGEPGKDHYRPAFVRALFGPYRSPSWMELSQAPLSVTQEAVALYRELVGLYRDSDRYRPGLAAALKVHGDNLAGSDRTAEAVPVLLEAVAIYRKLAETDPGRFRLSLAETLDKVGDCLIDLEYPAEALPVRRETVDIYRMLSETDSGFRRSLAKSLDKLGDCLVEFGRPEETVPVREEAVDSYGEDEEGVTPEYGIALSKLAMAYLQSDRPAEALSTGQMAALILREWDGRDPDIDRAEFAAALARAGAAILAGGWTSEALPVLQAAESRYRELTETNEEHRRGLAHCLSDLASAMISTGRFTEATSFMREAGEILAELGDRPGDMLADFPANMTKRDLHLYLSTQPAEVLPLTPETVSIYRRLAELYPDQRPRHANTAHRVAKHLHASRRPGEALPLLQEAVTAYRELNETHRDGYRSKLAAALSDLGDCLASLGRPDEAADARREAERIRNDGHGAS